MLIFRNKKKSPTFKKIENQYKNFEELTAGLRKAGLESSNLIIGVDFTKSNEWSGSKTFGPMSMHSLLPNRLNPYQSVMQVVAKSLEPFDEDKQIPVFGFGDVTTTDKRVFPFYPNRPCNGLNEILQRYGEIVPHIQLSGPTSFAPIIYEAINIVRETRSYHILVIIADGQVTDEAATRRAIVEASEYPLSIITVGVGDGPWDRMEEFDDDLPQRKFDNFQFVNYHQILTRYDNDPLAFATAALMEIPEQYQAIQRLGLLQQSK
jgi:E3 ubiquitin-protein ligase RGLG